MSIRTNEVNNGGILTITGGNMPTDNYTNAATYLSRSTGLPVTATVISNGHAVEIGGDGGVWDTVSGAIVQRDKTTLDTLNL